MTRSPTILVLLALLSPNFPFAQSFPPGFDCYKLTNDETRAACLGLPQRSRSATSNVGNFPPGFDCSRLTNPDSRAACFGQQGTSIPPPSLPTQPPSSTRVGPPPAQAEAPQKREPELSLTGTAFFVSRAGHMISNAHVVTGCARLVARRSTGSTFPVAVLATDKENDLALLQGPPTVATASFRRGPVPLGESVTVYGFPLAGALAATGNLTTGTVSALAGLFNDPSRYQISAPIQPGNSGGAALDESGLVVGVVVSKLDAVTLQRATGDIPQNINFAVKSSLVQNFLEANGVRMSEKSASSPKRVKDIAAEAVEFTVLLACLK